MTEYLLALATYCIECNFKMLYIYVYAKNMGLIIAVSGSQILDGTEFTPMYGILVTSLFEGKYRQIQLPTNFSQLLYVQVNGNDIISVGLLRDSHNCFISIKQDCKFMDSFEWLFSTV